MAAKLTETELKALETQLSVEKTMISKYKMYAQTCVDPQLKVKCEQIAAKHQNHFVRLVNQLK